jgi:hypothetical protein
MSTREVAEILGRAPTNLYGKNAPAGMPEPYQKVRAGQLWRADEIREFAANRKSQSGGTP